jgi:hypothetical protein
VNADLRTGSKPDLTAPKSDFCSTPESGLDSDIRPCRFRANKKLMQRSKLHRYSIASSALVCNVKGTVMPGVRTLRHEPCGRPKDGRAVAVTRQLLAR